VEAEGARRDEVKKGGKERRRRRNEVGEEGVEDAYGVILPSFPILTPRETRVMSNNEGLEDLVTCSYVT